MRWTPRRLRLALNLYPPYIGAGVRVPYIADDWRELRVEMKLRWYNRNAVGTHFGGNLYTMVDPHVMLLLMQLLGRDYVVWDKSAEIEFVRPGRGRVTATIRILEEDLKSIRRETAGGEPCFHRFAFDIVDEDGNVVAKVEKIEYARKRRQ